MQLGAHPLALAGALESAHSRAEVMRAVKAFLEGLTPEQRGRLPAACRDARIRDAEEVAEFAYLVAQARLALPFEGNALSDIDEFLARACARLAWLDTYGQPDRASTRASARQSRV
jgi:hypothetical protein